MLTVRTTILAAVLHPASFLACCCCQVGARVLLDCCQSVPHMGVDVQTLGADWIVGSSHKMCGPTGIGFLWGRHDVLESMPPWMGGGEMIQVRFFTAERVPALGGCSCSAVGQALDRASR